MSLSDQQVRRRQELLDVDRARGRHGHDFDFHSQIVGCIRCGITWNAYAQSILNSLATAIVCPGPSS